MCAMLGTISLAGGSILYGLIFLAVAAIALPQYFKKRKEEPRKTESAGFTVTTIVLGLIFTLSGLSCFFIGCGWLSAIPLVFGIGFLLLGARRQAENRKKKQQSDAEELKKW